MVYFHVEWGHCLNDLVDFIKDWVVITDCISWVRYHGLPSGLFDDSLVVAIDLNGLLLL